MKTMTLHIVTPESRHTIEDLTALNLQLEDGSIGIRPGHAPLIAEITGAVLLWRRKDEEHQEMLPGASVLQVAHDVVTIFSARFNMPSYQLPKRLLNEIIKRTPIEMT